MDKSDPTLSMSTLRNIIEGLKHSDQAITDVLARYNLDKTDLNSINGRVSLKSHVAILEDLAIQTGSPHLGLSVAKDIGPHLLGGVGYLFMSATTLGSAFETLAKYVGTIQESTISRVRTTKSTFCFEYQIIRDDIWPRRQDAEFSILSMANLSRRHSNYRCCPLEYYFEHEMVGSHSDYQSRLGAPCFFDQGINAIIFDKTDMNQRFKSQDGELFNVLRDLIERSTPNMEIPISFSEKVRSVMTERNIALGLNTEQTARRLNVSKITLYRALKKEGVTYREIRDDRRQELAERLLSHTTLPLIEISMRLGFAGPEVFSRAFKRWTGTPPKDWRAKQN